MDSYTCPQTPNDIPKALQCSTNIPHNSEHCFEALKIFAELRRPSETFANLRGSLDALYYLRTPSYTYPHLLNASWTCLGWYGWFVWSVCQISDIIITLRNNNAHIMQHQLTLPLRDCIPQCTASLGHGLVCPLPCLHGHVNIGP
jgi:hypothetical protein